MCDSEWWEGRWERVVGGWLAGEVRDNAAAGVSNAGKGEGGGPPPGDTQYSEMLSCSIMGPGAPCRNGSAREIACLFWRQDR